MGSRKATNPKTPKKATPRKQKSSAKEKDNGKIRVNKEIAQKCTSWLQAQKRVRAEGEMEIPDDELRDEDLTVQENPTEYDVTFRELAAAGKELGQTDVLYECEWGQCGQEFQGIGDHQKHIEGHVAELRQGVLEDDETFLCKWDLCEFDTTSKEALVRHVYVHAYHSRIKTAGASFCASVKVPACKIDSKQRNVIQDSRGDHFCYWDDCEDGPFVDIQRFYDHVRYHVTDNFYNRQPKCAVSCKWTQCKKTYAKEVHMQHHVISHTGQKLIACNNCGVRFVNKYRLVDHLKRQMEGTGAHNCPHCFRSFAFEKQLRCHMKCHINCVKCTLCDMTCASQGALVKHIRYRHVKERPFQCMLCDFKAVMKRDLEVHMSVHDPNFFFRCGEPGCDYMCKAIATLKKHEAKHDGVTKLFKCHICDKTFQIGTRLSKHLISRHDFQHPSGFQRFHYKQEDDGFYHLQLTRLESLEVSEQIVNQDEATQGSITPMQTEQTMKRIEDFDMMKKYLRADKDNEIMLEVVDEVLDKKETFIIQQLVAKNQ